MTDNTERVIGELQGISKALLLASEANNTVLDKLCERMRHVEISLATLLPAKADIEKLEKKIDRLEAHRNWTIGAAAALSVVGPFLAQFVMQILHVKFMWPQ